MLCQVPGFLKVVSGSSRFLWFSFELYSGVSEMLSN